VPLTVIINITITTVREYAAEIGASIIILGLLLLLKCYVMIGWVKCLATLLVELIGRSCRHGAIHPIVVLWKLWLLALLHWHEIGMADATRL